MVIKFGSLAEDWRILDDIKENVFISEVPQNARPGNPNNKRVGDAEVVEQLCRLKHLERVSLSIKLSLENIEKFLVSCPKLIWGSFVTLEHSVLKGFKSELIQEVGQMLESSSSSGSETTESEEEEDRA